MTFVNRISEEVRTLPASQFLAHPDNPKEHPFEQREALRRALQRLGFVLPVLVNERTGYLLDGHERIFQALETDAEVPYVTIDATEEEERLILATLDPIGMLARHDKDKLKALLQSFPEGEDFEALADAIAKDNKITLEDLSVWNPEEASETPDASGLEALKKKWAVQRGDLFSIKSKRGGSHRLLCGDTSSPEDMKRLMNGRRASCIFTDPPYNLAEKNSLIASDVSGAMNDLKNSEWDKDFKPAVFLQNMLNFCSNDLTVYVCMSHHTAPEVWNFFSTFADFYFFVVWNKPNPMPSLMKRHWTWDTELIGYATRGKHIFNFPYEGHAPSTWVFTKHKETAHPTEKPVSLVRHALLHSTTEGTLVLDGFGGSGSTMMASELTGRLCYTMEIAPVFCSLILERAELSGLEITKEAE